MICLSQADAQRKIADPEFKSLTLPKEYSAVGLDTRISIFSCRDNNQDIIIHSEKSESRLLIFLDSVWIFDSVMTIKWSFPFLPDSNGLRVIALEQLNNSCPGSYIAFRTDRKVKQGDTLTLSFLFSVFDQIYPQRISIELCRKPCIGLMRQRCYIIESFGSINLGKPPE